jgi:hypothetical protein
VKGLLFNRWQNSIILKWDEFRRGSGFTKSEPGICLKGNK